jgi:hypothetical protein
MPWWWSRTPPAQWSRPPAPGCTGRPPAPGWSTSWVATSCTGGVDLHNGDGGDRASLRNRRPFTFGGIDTTSTSAFNPAQPAPDFAIAAHAPVARSESLNAYNRETAVDLMDAMLAKQKRGGALSGGLAIGGMPPISCSYPVDTLERAGESCAELRDERSYLQCFSVHFFLEKSKLRQLEIFGPTGPVSIGFDTVTSIRFRIRCQPPVGRFGRCSSERMRMACRVAVTGLPYRDSRCAPMNCARP